jgi:hypothetical protein
MKTAMGREDDVRARQEEKSIGLAEANAECKMIDREMVSTQKVQEKDTQAKSAIQNVCKR